MANILFDVRIKKSALVLSISKDWNTPTPWKHQGKLMPYIGIRRNISETCNVYFTYVYLGPFSLVIGTLIK